MEIRETEIKSLKRGLRKELRRLEPFADAKSKATADARILDALCSLKELERADTVFVFLSTNEEVDTRGLISWLFSQGKRVCAPVCEGGGIMYAAELETPGGLCEGMFGIQEPTGKRVDRDEIDFVLVPGLAFDRKGRRLGKGRGYYDRYLAGHSAVKCGVCCSAFLLDEVPTEENDMPVGIVLTENETIHF